MPKGIYPRKSKGATEAAPFSFEQGVGPVAEAAPETIDITPPATAAAIEANRPKRVRMELLRHYVPHEQPPRVVGWNRPEVKVKEVGGRERVVQEAGFVEGEMCPPPFPGVGYGNKVWAGTVIDVPEDEARIMRAKKIAEAWI